MPCFTSMPCLFHQISSWGCMLRKSWRKWKKITCMPWTENNGQCFFLTLFISIYNKTLTVTVALTYHRLCVCCVACHFFWFLHEIRRNDMVSAWNWHNCNSFITCTNKSRLFSINIFFSCLWFSSLWRKRHGMNISDFFYMNSNGFFNKFIVKPAIQSL